MSYDDDNDGGMEEYAQRQAECEEADYKAWIAEMESFAAHEQFLTEMQDGQHQTS